MITCFDRPLACRVSVIYPAAWQLSKAQSGFKFGISISSETKTTSGIHLCLAHSGLHGVIHVPLEKERASISSFGGKE